MLTAVAWHLALDVTVDLLIGASLALIAVGLWRRWRSRGEH